MIDARITGPDPDGGDPLEASIKLNGAPRVGDHLSVWMDKPDKPLGSIGMGEVYLEVEMVAWPTWGYDFIEDREIAIHVRREGDLSDDQWRDVFQAIRDGRKP